MTKRRLHSDGLTARVETLERRVAALERNMPDKKLVHEEFQFLREQAKLTNKALDAILETLKLHEDRD